MFLLFSNQLYAQDHFERFTINLGVIHPVLKAENSHFKYSLDSEIDVLINFRISKNSKLSTGVGFQKGEHNWSEDISEIVWVDEETGWLPMYYTNRWTFNYSSLGIPFYYESSFKNSSKNFFTTGVKFGWHNNVRLTEKHSPNFEVENYDRFFCDFKLELKRIFLQSNRLTFGLDSFVGYHGYFSHNNKWQKNYFFYGIKFTTNF